MKLSDYKNEDALDLLADLMEPVADIMADAELKALATKQNANKLEIAQYVLRNKKAQLVTIFARMNNTPRNEYKATAPEMLAQLLDALNDKALADFFASQAQQKIGASSGLVTENTEATDEA